MYINGCYKCCAPFPPVCSAITAKLEELQQATKTLCGNYTKSVTIEKGEYLSYFVTWKSVPITSIGNTEFHSRGTLSYEIPSIIPDEAMEVLIYVYFYKRSSSGWLSHFKIHTEGDNGEEYSKYISLSPFSHSYSHSSNTDNLWFPMPRSRRIFLNVPYALSNSIGGYLYAIGYR